MDVRVSYCSDGEDGCLQEEQRQEVCRIRGMQDKRDEGQRYAG